MTPTSAPRILQAGRRDKNGSEIRAARLFTARNYYSGLVRDRNKSRPGIGSGAREMIRGTEIEAEEEVHNGARTIQR